MDQCVAEFEALSFEKTRDVASFNALFKDIKVKIDDTSLKIPISYYIMKYLRWIAPAFPT